MLKRNSHLIALCAALFFALACGSVHAQPSHAKDEVEAGTTASSITITKLKLASVGDFGEVTSTLYRGKFPHHKGLRNLKEMGFDIIVDLRGNKHRARRQVESLGMEYIPIGGLCFPPKDSYYAKFLSVIDNNPGKKIFAGCRLGDDRTGMAVAAFRMANQGWTSEEAMEEMRAYGYNAFHHVMCPLLARYEKDFLQRYATSPEFAPLRESHPAVAPQQPPSHPPAPPDSSLLSSAAPTN